MTLDTTNSSTKTELSSERLRYSGTTPTSLIGVMHHAILMAMARRSARAGIGGHVSRDVCRMASQLDHSARPIVPMRTRETRIDTATLNRGPAGKLTGPFSCALAPQRRAQVHKSQGRWGDDGGHVATLCPCLSASVTRQRESTHFQPGRASPSSSTTPDPAPDIRARHHGAPIKLSHG